MKTIFIIISRGIIARNILRTGIIDHLLRDENIRIVLMLPSEAPQYLKEEFNHSRIIIENTGEGELSRIQRKFFLPLIDNLVYTKGSRLLSRYGTYKKKGKNTIIYFLEAGIFGVLSQSTVLKKIFRWLELYLFKEKKYEHFFDKYKPDLIFSTTILGKVDIAFLKIAKKKKIKTVAMAKGWDTVDRRLFRVEPDKMIVFNQSMKETVSNLQNICAEKILVTGFPQFDIYSKKELIILREEFFKKKGLDPNKKLISFGSEGLWGRADEGVANIICNFIKNKELLHDASLVIRPHYSDIEKKRFLEFNKYDFVYIDNKHRITNLFLDSWDASKEEMIDFFNMLYHSDVIISTCSTLSLDGSMLDKPLISIAFDAVPQADFRHSVNYFYSFSHFNDVVETGGVSMVSSPEDLKNQINEYLENYSLHSEGRRRIVEQLCYKNDGQANKRIANSLLEILVK